LTSAKRLKAKLSSPGGIAAAAILLVGVGIAAGVVLGRRAAAPPGTLHTAPAASWMHGTASTSLDLQALAREIEREDAPTQALLDFAHLALDQQQFVLAIQTYKRVLARDPKNPAALTHVAHVLYRANHVDQALARLDEALSIDPNYAHAHWDRAHILYETKKDLAGAAKSFEAFLARIPTGPDADRARSLLAEIRRGGGTTKP
jgi:regulator of sirC expression with transglutaminase-like and TPR domain